MWEATGLVRESESRRIRAKIDHPDPKCDRMSDFLKKSGPIGTDIGTNRICDDYSVEQSYQYVKLKGIY